jgi:hypothetical protein
VLRINVSLQVSKSADSLLGPIVNQPGVSC